MGKPKILVQLDTDPLASVFDGVVAVDAGVDHLFARSGVTADNVRDQVFGAIFTRGPEDLRHTAIFIGGSNVAAGETLLAEIRRAFFGPMRVSAMIDSNGANTTAAAAVLAAGRHVDLASTSALVLGGTGPVGQRVARLLAREGTQVRVGSRDVARAQVVVDQLTTAIPGARLAAVAASNSAAALAALEGAQLVIAAGAAGAELLGAADRALAKSLEVAIDLNAVPPVGLAGIESTDYAKTRDGVVAYGAIGIGRTKMKIHKRAVQALFDANNLVLDAEEIFAIGRELE